MNIENKVEELIQFLENTCYRYDSCQNCNSCRFREYLELKNVINRGV